MWKVKPKRHADSKWRIWGQNKVFSFLGCLPTIGHTTFGIISTVTSQGKCMTALKSVWGTTRVYTCAHTHIHVHTSFGIENKNNHIFIIVKTKKKTISIIKLIFWGHSNIILFHIINFNFPSSIDLKTNALLEGSMAPRPEITNSWTSDP